MPHHGMMYKRWLKTSKPTVISLSRKDNMVIIHSIEPYTPKRPRE
jgi:hypothetical protein